MKNGEEFDGYNFDELHHWNWYIEDHALHALDPRHLFPMSISYMRRYIREQQLDLFGHHSTFTFNP